MVVFTCNACCAVLKRNQVDKHCERCRRCESLACVDCGKDFWGDDYQQHTKCITEEEKYGGKNNVPKVFKGEAKQEQWVEQVQAAIEKASSNPKLRGLLERVKECPNIPRKKQKFENFVKNSLRVNIPSLISEVWEILMSGNNKPQTQNDNKKEDNESNSNQSGSITNGHSQLDENSEMETSESNVPKNKREKKEDRKKKSHKREKKDKVVETAQTDSTEDDPPKKSKKRKRQESEGFEEQNIDVNGDGDKDSNVSKKKKKKAKGDDNNTDEIKETSHDTSNIDNGLEDTEVPPSKKQKTKFNWEKVIKAVLEKKGEMTLKKLKKKVLSEFAAQEAANYNEDNLSAKFDKKILKTDGVKVAKDRASLKAKKIG